MSQFEFLLRDCDNDIKSGKLQHVSKRLAQFETSRIPREFRVPLAKICRRAGLYTMGLRLLAKFVRGRAPTATPAELTEYAALLVRIGTVEEAITILKTVNTAEIPEALLIRAFAHFTLWEYENAIDVLESYLKNSLAPDVQLVGRSNLAFALVETRQHEKARRLLSENVQLGLTLGYTHLQVYNEALLAQVDLQEEDYVSARRRISSVADRVGDASAYNNWSMLKLKLIIDALEKRSLAPLDELRRQAKKKQDWPALRDADLFSLKIRFDTETFLHLFFGSPLPGFRERFCRELDRSPERQIYILGKKSAPRFDLETGEFVGQEVIRVGSKCHQMLCVLLHDFYQPVRVGGLHAALFPGEHFDILSSPDRIHQLIRLTRNWLRKNRIPARIIEDRGFYSFVIEGNISFRISIRRPAQDPYHFQIQTLKRFFSSRQIFSARGVQEQLKISRSSAHRLLQRAIEEGDVERLGKIKRPLGYRFRASISAAA